MNYIDFSYMERVAKRADKVIRSSYDDIKVNGIEKISEIKKNADENTNITLTSNHISELDYIILGYLFLTLEGLDYAHILGGSNLIFKPFSKDLLKSNRFISSILFDLEKAGIDIMDRTSILKKGEEGKKARQDYENKMLHIFNRPTDNLSFTSNGRSKDGFNTIERGTLGLYVKGQLTQKRDRIITPIILSGERTPEDHIFAFEDRMKKYAFKRYNELKNFMENSSNEKVRNKSKHAMKLNYAAGYTSFFLDMMCILKQRINEMKTGIDIDIGDSIYLKDFIPNDITEDKLKGTTKEYGNRLKQYLDEQHKKYSRLTATGIVSTLLHEKNGISFKDLVYEIKGLDRENMNFSSLIEYSPARKIAERGIRILTKGRMKPALILSEGGLYINKENIISYYKNQAEHHFS